MIRTSDPGSAQSFARGLRSVVRVVVGERSSQRRSDTVTSRGAAASDYAGLSNEKTGENPVRRKPKVSWGR
jgi:hypothetical protein